MKRRKKNWLLNGPRIDCDAHPDRRGIDWVAQTQQRDPRERSDHGSTTGTRNLGGFSFTPATISFGTLSLVKILNFWPRQSYLKPRRLDQCKIFVITDLSFVTKPSVWISFIGSTISGAMPATSLVPSLSKRAQSGI